MHGLTKYMNNNVKFSVVDLNTLAIMIMATVVEVCMASAIIITNLNVAYLVLLTHMKQSTSIPSNHSS